MIFVLEETFSTFGTLGDCKTSKTIFDTYVYSTVNVGGVLGRNTSLIFQKHSETSVKCQYHKL